MAKKMSEVLTEQGHEVTIIDNGSTYPELLDWYSNNKNIKIIMLNKNLGHTAPWQLGFNNTNEYYVVTDPDLDISDIPNDWDSVLIEGINKFGSNLMLDGQYINKPIDTTFAVHAPFSGYFIGGIRTNYPYAAKHLPWHVVLKTKDDGRSFQIEMNDEIYYYFANSNNSNLTKPRLNNMLNEYSKLKI